MRREIDRLSGATFDVLVVGGGICGLAIAYDAAQRGASVALVERGDFGSGASFNHLRTIHGGLRYLQSLDLVRARESVRERRTLARIASHTVRPLPFVLPLRRSIRRGRLAMRAAFALDRLVAHGRNRGVPATHRLAPGRVFSRAAAVERFPGLFRSGLTGAAVWEDYVTVEADRLTFSVALAASREGAVLANHVEALGLLRDGPRVAGAEVVDRVTRSTFPVTARLTIVAAGAAIAPLVSPLGISANMPLVRAMNLVTSRDAGEEAIGGSGPDGRNFFLVPWKGRAVFGTWESGSPVEPQSTAVEPAEVAAFISALNGAFPGLDLRMRDVTLVHRGVVPAVDAGGGRVTLRAREAVVDHAAQGAEGLFTVAATKFTTFRAVAERVVGLVFDRLGCTAVCRTADTLLPGGGVPDVGLAVAQLRRDWDADVPGDTIPHLVAAYGTDAAQVLALAREAPAWRARVAEHSPVIGAELVRAVRQEMAVTLADAVIRRTPLGALGDPGDQALDVAAAIVGRELGWTPQRRQEEIDAVQAVYGSVNALKT